MRTSESFLSPGYHRRQRQQQLEKVTGFIISDDAPLQQLIGYVFQFPLQQLLKPRLSQLGGVGRRSTTDVNCA